MKPNESEQARLDRVTGELAAREPIFHRPEFGTTRRDFDLMMADEFWEIGASGQKYSREQVLDVLEQRHKSHVVEACPGAVQIPFLRPCGAHISPLWLSGG